MAAEQDGEDAIDAGIGKVQFVLIDQDRRTRTEKDFTNEYLLVYFGYTGCPDICPTSLYTMSSAIRKVEKQGLRIRPLFISVDTEHDTPEKLGEYAAAFHPRMLGLTGTPKQVRQAASELNAHFMLVEYKGRTLVDHTADVYFIGPHGNFLKRFPHGTNSGDMARTMLTFMQPDTTGNPGLQAAEQTTSPSQ